MKYLTKEQIEQLTNDELDNYSKDMSNAQVEILDLMDNWVDAYNIASDAYDKRLNKVKKFLIQNDDTVKH